MSFSPAKEEFRHFHETVLDHDVPAIFSVEGRYTLDSDTAKALQKELAELAEQYKNRQTEKGHVYSVRFGITPLQDESLEP